MYWAQTYSAVFLAASVAGLVIDARNPRRTSELAINILAVLAPALLVVAYIEPELFEYRISLIALFAITLITNWLSGHKYVQELNEALPEDEAANMWVMSISVLVVLLPAFWFGAKAFLQMT